MGHRNPTPTSQLANAALTGRCVALQRTLAGCRRLLLTLAIAVPAAACSDNRVEQILSVESRSIPLGVRFAGGQTECRFAHLALSAVIETPERIDLTEAAAALDGCAEQTLAEVTVSTLIDTPAGIAVSLGSAFGACLIAATGNDIRLVTAEAAVVNGDWTLCRD
jgi:hypothetical protein